MPAVKEQILVCPMKKEDSVSVLEIYQDSIQFDDATCVMNLPSWEEWSAQHDPHMRFVAKIANQVVGFVALSQVFRSPAYQGVGEISIYVRKQFRHAGVGTALFTCLIQEVDSEEQLRTNGYYMLQSRIFTNNQYSIALHEKMGFRLVGKREKILKKKGIWRDVYVYERRANLEEME